MERLVRVMAQRRGEMERLVRDGTEEGRDGETS